MRRIQTKPGVILYEKEDADYLAEDLERSARRYAQTFDDRAAARVPNLFPRWQCGETYLAGTRLTDGKGNLYKVLQGHTSQADWPIQTTAALYQPLETQEGLD